MLCHFLGHLSGVSFSFCMLQIILRVHVRASHRDVFAKFKKINNKLIKIN